MSAGGDSYITYHYELDRDGDAFIGYSIGDPVPPPGAVLSDAFPIDGVMKGQTERDPSVGDYSRPMVAYTCRKPIQ